MDNLLNKIDLFTTDCLNEIMKKVIRKGKVKRKTICPLATMKAQDGKCVMMDAGERKARNKAAIKRGRELKANIGVQKKAAKKRAKSLKKRLLAIPDVKINNSGEK
jgi:hypothetical protein